MTLRRSSSRYDAHHGEGCTLRRSSSRYDAHHGEGCTLRRSSSRYDAHCGEGYTLPRFLVVYTNQERKDLKYKMLIYSNNFVVFTVLHTGKIDFVIEYLSESKVNQKNS